MKNFDPSANLPPEGVDRLLGEYFKSQLPKEWPAAPKMGSVKPSQKNGPVLDTMTASRWALAASVMCLLFGCWYVSSQSDNGKPRNSTDLEGSTANAKILKDMGKKQN